MSRVFLTERALRDLSSIRGYSLEKFGEQVTRDYLARFDRTLDLLAASPGLLRRRPAVSGRLLFHRVGRHWMICDRIEGVVFVLAVMYGAMDIQERAAELEPTLITESELLHRSIFRDAPPDKHSP